jgi:WD40 repeat protein
MTPRNSFLPALVLIGSILSIFGQASDPAGAKFLFGGLDKKILGFTPKGKLAAISPRAQSFHFYDLTKGMDPVSQWPIPDNEGLIDAVLASDGRTVTFLSQAGKDQSRIRLCDTSTGKVLKPEFALTDVGAVSFSSDGKILAGINSGNGAIRLWNASSGELISSMDLPSQIQAAWIGVAFSPDGRYLAARTSFSYTVWDIAKKGIATPGGERDILIALSPDWKLAVGALNGSGPGAAPKTVLLNFADPNKPVSPPKAPSEPLDWVAFSHDSELLALRRNDNTIGFWDTAKQRYLKASIPTSGGPIEMAFSPDKRFLITHESELLQRQRVAHVRIWDVPTGTAVTAAHGVQGFSMQCHFDKDSRFLAVAFTTGDYAVIWKLPPAQ